MKRMSFPLLIALIAIIPIVPAQIRFAAVSQSRQSISAARGAGDLASSAPVSAAMATTATALTWLAGQQDLTGAWSASTPGLAARDTAAAVAALAAAGDHGAAFIRGTGWLAGR